jgi:hypothetical protein
VIVSHEGVVETDLANGDAGIPSFGIGVATTPGWSVGTRDDRPERGGGHRPNDLGAEVSLSVRSLAELMDESKQCPDCAEQVLAQARKCRYCGYRFDRRDRSPLLGDLRGNLRKDAPDRTLPRLLADWGVSLADGEQVRFFRLVEIDGKTGYLLVTGSRLAFFVARGRSQYDKLLEFPLARVSTTHVHGRLRRRRLQLSGATFDHVVGTGSRGDLQQLAKILSGYAPDSRVTEADRALPGEAKSHRAS